MEIYGKIYKNWSAKNKSFFVKKDFSLEAVSPVKNSDRTVNNTHTVVNLQFRIQKTSQTVTLVESIQQPQ